MAVVSKAGKALHNIPRKCAVNHPPNFIPWNERHILSRSLPLSNMPYKAAVSFASPQRRKWRNNPILWLPNVFCQTKHATFSIFKQWLLKKQFHLLFIFKGKMSTMKRTQKSLKIHKWCLGYCEGLASDRSWKRTISNKKWMTVQLPY